MNWNSNCKPNCGCGNNGCNCSVNGGYSNGILTVTVGSSTAVIPLTQASIETRTPVQQEFNISSGNIVILSHSPILSLGVHIHRNGLILQTSEYVLSGNTITFVTPFGNSTGATGSEFLTVNYYRV